MAEGQRSRVGSFTEGRMSADLQAFEERRHASLYRNGPEPLYKSDPNDYLRKIREVGEGFREPGSF